MVHITLVHGTNASDGTWFREGSFFREQLQIRLGYSVSYHYLLWDGHNSHESRLRAAERLSNHVADIQSNFPDSHQYVICHSHGGNIALYAAKDPNFECVVLGIATMGTPFIHCAPNQLTGIFANMSSYIVTMAIAVFCLALLPVMALLFMFKPHFITSLFGNWDDFVWITPILFGFTYAFALLVQLVLKKSLSVAEYLQIVQSETVDLLTLAPWPGERLFIARIAADEAGWWLRRISNLGGAPHRLNGFLDALAIASYFPRRWLGITLVTLSAALVDPIGLREQGWTIQGIFTSLIFGYFFAYLLAFAAEAVGLAATAMTATIAAILPLYAVIVRSHKFGFGAERILQAASVDLRTRSTPPTAKGAPEILEAASGRFLGLFGGLRHSVFYESPHVVQAIASWIARIETVSTVNYPAHGITSISLPAAPAS